LGKGSMGRTERKEQILESAARLFSSRRFDEVLMDDIAHEAGVAKGTLYTYFPAKEELYFAVVFEGLSRLNDQLERHALGDLPPEQKLREVMHAIIAFLKQNRFFFRLMSIEDGKSESGRGEYRGRWHQQRRRQKEALEAVLRSGMESGVFHIEHLSTEAQILRGMVRSVLHRHGEQLNVDEMVDVVLRIFLHGVRTRS
jgi:TetR/AcrR family transcriptional regulator, cholesterol catabolism regulator